MLERSYIENQTAFSEWPTRGMFGILLPFVACVVLCEFLSVVYFPLFVKLFRTRTELSSSHELVAKPYEENEAKTNNWPYRGSAQRSSSSSR
jgi:hypothetical protein